MLSGNDPVVPAGFERVRVAGSPTNHLARPAGVFSLCGRLPCLPVRYQAPKPMCRRCQAEAAILIREAT